MCGKMRELKPGRIVNTIFHRCWPAAVMTLALLALYANASILLNQIAFDHAESIAKTPSLSAAFMSFRALWWLPFLLLLVPFLPSTRRSAVLILSAAVLIMLPGVPVRCMVYQEMKRGVIISVKPLLRSRDIPPRLQEDR
jgi:hypothetical protein